MYTALETIPQGKERPVVGTEQRKSITLSLEVTPDW